MDTSFKIISKDKIITLGADHFGYEDLTFKALYILLKLICKENVSEDELDFIKSNLYEHKFSEDEDFDYTFDIENEKVYMGLGFELYKLEDYEKDISYTKMVNFNHIELMSKKEMSFKEFNKLCKFILKYIAEEKLVINYEYIYIHQNSKKNEN